MCGQEKKKKRLSRKEEEEGKREEWMMFVCYAHGWKNQRASSVLSSAERKKKDPYMGLHFCVISRKNWKIHSSDNHFLFATCYFFVFGVLKDPRMVHPILSLFAPPPPLLRRTLNPYPQPPTTKTEEGWAAFSYNLFLVFICPGFEKLRGTLYN